MNSPIPQAKDNNKTFTANVKEFMLEISFRWRILLPKRPHK